MNNLPAPLRYSLMLVYALTLILLGAAILGVIEPVMIAAPLGIWFTLAFLTVLMQFLGFTANTKF